MSDQQKVWIVDDDKSIRWVLEKALQKTDVEIQSFSKRKVKMDVIDRVPHSLSTQIEVKIDLEKIAPKKHELGIIEWQRELEPNEKKSIEYDYEVVWDRDVTISPPLP